MANKGIQLLTCYGCKANVPVDKAEHVVVKGVEHVVCQSCCAEQEHGLRDENYQPVAVGR